MGKSKIVNQCAAHGNRISKGGCFLEQCPHNSSVSTTLLAALHKKIVGNYFKTAALLMNNLAVVCTLFMIYNDYICCRSSSLYLPLKT